MARDLLDLGEATSRLRPFRRHVVGIRPISLETIVGTDGRGADFDRAFRPRRRDVAERLGRVEDAFPHGDFPPITVQRLGEAHFVVDGHHRVAAARRRRMETIDAEVTELTARWHLRADADAEVLVHAEQERIFVTETGLERACPRASCFRFTRPVGYVELLEVVEAHGFRLALERRQAPHRTEAALDWYARVYLPTVEAMTETPLSGACRDATDADRFLWVHGLRPRLLVEHGTRELPDVVRHLAAGRRDRVGRRRRA